MSDAALGVRYRPLPATGPGILQRIRLAEPRFFDLGVVLLILIAPTAAAMAVDGRLTNDVSVWAKPLKFEISLASYYLTLAAFTLFVPEATRRRRGWRLFIGAVIVATVFEMVWLIGAASLGVPSHFNQTPAGAAIYRAMGLAAILLTSTTALYAWAIARNGATGLSPALKEGLVLGLALTFPLTLASAGAMAVGSGHWIGGAPSDANGLALMGWARDGGDLRVAHFFGTHAMQFVPGFALVSAALLGGGRVWPVRAFAASFAVFVAWTMVQAYAGQPFLPWLG